MDSFSKSQERDENRKINSGIWLSVFALLFCWLPGVGLALGIGGYGKQAVRITKAHRGKLVFATIFSLLSLAVAIGALLGEIYLYVRNPDIVPQSAAWVWKQLTGQDSLPGAGAADGAVSYPELGSMDPMASVGESADAGGAPDLYNADADGDYDADFNDAELAGFPEDAEADLPAEGDKALFDQMLEDKKSGNSSLLPVG